MQQAFLDLRIAARRLRRSPLFLAAVILSTVAPVTLNSTIFAVVHAVLLKPLPFRDPHSLVVVSRSHQYLAGVVSRAEFSDWTERNRVFTSLAAWSTGELDVLAPAGVRRVAFAAVTRNLPEFLGVTPLLGRFFQPGEADPNVVLLTEWCWRASFNSDRSAIGRSVRLDDERGYEGTYVIVGVLPRDFTLYLADDCELLVPTRGDWTNRADRSSGSLTVLGRLRNDVSLAQAKAAMTNLVAALAREYPKTPPSKGADVRRYQEVVTASVRPALVFLMYAAAVVMVLACANIASLLLARGVTRSGEMAIRLALGARRHQLVVQLLMEQVVVAALAGIVSVAFVALTHDGAMSVIPATLARRQEVRVSGAVVAFTVAACVAVSLAASLLPAWFFTRRHGATTGQLRSRMVHNGLVVAQIAVALALLASGALVITGFQRLARLDLGFSPSGTLVADVALPRRVWSDRATYTAFRHRLIAQVRSSPFVVDASLTSDLPGVLHFKGLIIGVRAASGSFEDCVWRVVGANYLRVLGASIVSGRDLDVRDETGPPVVVINETLRQRLGLSANPVGQGLWISEWYTIVGVVRDVHELGPRERVPPVVYMPLSDRSWTPTHLWLLVRPTRWGSLAGLREQLARLDPGLPVCRLATLQDVVASTMAETKFYAVTFAAFSAVALLLATAGLFALVSSGVETRIREIGVRMALGATPGRIAGAILRHAALLTCFGTFSGLGMFWAIARLLRAAIPDVAPADVPTVTAAMFLIAVTACAAVLPTLRRASSLQPIEVLRHE